MKIREVVVTGQNEVELQTMTLMLLYNPLTSY